MNNWNPTFCSFFNFTLRVTVLICYCKLKPQNTNLLDSKINITINFHSFNIVTSARACLSIMIDPSEMLFPGPSFEYAVDPEYNLSKGINKNMSQCQQILLRDICVQRSCI